jgi:hypothetical protein
VNDGIRVAAVVAAAALLAAPYWKQIAAAVRRAVEACVQSSGTIARVAAAALLIAAAWGKVPLPSFSVPAAVPAVTVETPSDEMQAVVAPVAHALRNAPLGDRMTWARVWEKVAIVAAGDAINGEVVFTDTRSLAAYTKLALEIGWRRLGKVEPGYYPELRAAVEGVMRDVLTLDVKPVDAELRKKYAVVAKAIAWAGLPRE